MTNAATIHNSRTSVLDGDLRYVHLPRHTRAHLLRPTDSEGTGTWARLIRSGRKNPHTYCGIEVKPEAPWADAADDMGRCTNCIKAEFAED